MKYLHKPLFIFLFLLFQGCILSAQDYGFRNPLEIPLTLSGTFAELRGNHFHAGLDIRTNGTEGYKVYAIGDGYVSRVKVSPWGYGKVVYIAHPNGITSVYAHLQRFKGDLADFVLEQQYYRESFSIDLYLPAGKIPVKKGDVIALSGNTGGSGGPHLHFELRTTSNQHPVNPLEYGFKIDDFKSPVIRSLRIYPVEGKSKIEGGTNSRVIMLRNSGGAYTPSIPDTLDVEGPFFMGISVYDQQNGSYNKNGFYEIILEVDDQKFWHIKGDEFSYSESRYINSLIDYNLYKANGERYVITRVQSNNRLNIYETVKDDGIIHFKEKGLHSLTYRVRDFAGNESAIMILVRYKGDPEPYKLASVEHGTGVMLDPDKTTDYRADGISISFPSGAVYESFELSIEEQARRSKAYAPSWKIHDHHIPVHKSYSLTIKADTVPEAIASKMMIKRLSPGTNYYRTERKGDLFTAKVRDFGLYTVAADTIKPLIKPLNISQNSILSSSSSIRIKVKDYSSGINSFRAEVDGEWILMEYEPKKSLLYHEFDGHIKKGKHTFRLEVTDLAGNKNSYECSFTR